MASEKDKRRDAAIIVSDRAEIDILLGPPPLLEGEDASPYEELRRRIRDSVAPRDVIEEPWVRDVIDLLWENLRLRRLKAKFMRVADRGGIFKTMDPFVLNLTTRTELAQGWFARKKSIVKRVDGYTPTH
jgi:hypothetical protein